MEAIFGINLNLNDHTNKINSTLTYIEQLTFRTSFWDNLGSFYLHLLLICVCLVSFRDKLHPTQTRKKHNHVLMTGIQIIQIPKTAIWFVVHACVCKKCQIWSKRKQKQWKRKIWPWHGFWYRSLKMNHQVDHHHHYGKLLFKWKKFFGKFFFHHDPVFISFVFVLFCERGRWGAMYVFYISVWFHVYRTSIKVYTLML